MGVAVSQQVFALTGALLLGLGLGLVYDLLRVLRSRWHSGGVGAALDLLFWFLAALVLVLWSVYALGGVVRVYIVLAMAAGVWLWFATFSPGVSALLQRWADECARLVHILLFPVRKLGEQKKKFQFFLKNHFHYFQSWYRIRTMFAPEKPPRQKNTVVHREGKKCENHKGKSHHKKRYFDFDRLFGHQPAESAHQDPDGNGGLQRHSDPGGRPGGKKRRRGGAHPQP
jgi:spore cortex biosynthesis protein YabQ